MSGGAETVPRVGDGCWRSPSEGSRPRHRPAENVASAPTRHHGDPERHQHVENALACLAYSRFCSSLQGTKLRGGLGGPEELEETQGRGGRSHQAVRGHPQTQSRSRSDYCTELDISVSKWRLYAVVSRAEVTGESDRKSQATRVFSRPRGTDDSTW